MLCSENKARWLLLGLIMVGLLIESSLSLAESRQYTLTVDMAGFQVEGGQHVISVFSSPSSFLGQAIAEQVISHDQLSIDTVSFQLPAGVYAISAYHDENSNSELDTGFMGIPSEPYGFSKNPSTRWGPPAFRDAALTLNQDTVVRITYKPR